MSYDPGGVGSEHIRKHYIAGRDDYRVLKYLVQQSVLRRNEEAIRASCATWAAMASFGGDWTAAPTRNASSSWPVRNGS